MDIFYSQIKMSTKIDYLMSEILRGDNSFKERSTPLEILFGRNKYTKEEMRKTWESGIRHGLEQGLYLASVEGQRVELYGNAQTPRQKEYLDKVYALAAEYNMAIQYHVQHGMMVIDRSYK